jgi:molecular chaperone GrpE
MEEKEILESIETEKKKTKKHSYKKELEKTLQEKEELKDKLLRLAAEFDNFRKRTEREFALVRENAKADVISAVLTVLDDLDRSLEAGEQDPESVLDGLKIIQKSFLKSLESHGLKVMESVGEPFDPEKHDALLQVESDELDPDHVVDEHVKGYKLNDRVLRHAKVVVSK